MPDDCSAYAYSSFFSPLIQDYLQEKEQIKPLYHRFPKLENYKAQLEEKAANFPAHFREVLVNTLEAQYQNISTSTKTQHNLERLRKENTFTITTGHQLNIGTGPLYFLYKIISTINLCIQLQEAYPEQHFVPVYWMATEDHDLEEINHLYVKNKKVIWNKQGTGAVGRMQVEGMEAVIAEMNQLLGNLPHKTELIALFEAAYQPQFTLAEATRILANSLFGNYGLVIVDGDTQALKTLFTPYIQAELHEQFSHAAVSATTPLMQGYKIQVNPREINLFYLDKNVRERLVFENNRYKVLNTALEFSAEEIQKLAEEQPEKFSPNVLLRPLYQEVILPNLCYIGGGGEIAYWLELKSMFTKANTTFPMLMLRNSVVTATHKTKQKWAKTGMSWEDLFLTPRELTAKFLSKTTPKSVDFTNLKKQLAQQFEVLQAEATTTDPSFSSMLKAQEVKQMKGLASLEKRLHKAQIKANQESIDRILTIQNEVFPNQSLLERKTNFSDYYSEVGSDFIAQLFDQLDPLQMKFTSLYFD
jgi:bacillithiol biosynthesis cysteine-adding enzyme BshC